MSYAFETDMPLAKPHIESHFDGNQYSEFALLEVEERLTFEPKPGQQPYFALKRMMGFFAEETGLTDSSYIDGQNKTAVAIVADSDSVLLVTAQRFFTINPKRPTAYTFRGSQGDYTLTGEQKVTKDTIFRVDPDDTIIFGWLLEPHSNNYLQAQSRSEPYAPLRSTYEALSGAASQKHAKKLSTFLLGLTHSKIQ